MQSFATRLGRAPAARLSLPKLRPWLGAALALLALWPTTSARAQAPPLLQSARYWFDSGTKTTLTAADGAFDSALETAVGTAAGTLSIGAHKLRIEMQGADGSWGPAVSSTVAVLGAVSRTVSLQSGEVQIDNAAAVAVTATDGAFNDVVETVVKGALASGTVGNHTVKLRLKDAQGNNGPWFTSAYAVLGGVARTIQVLSGEVQIDAAAAVAVIALDGSFNDVVETVVKGGLTAGTVGNHTVKIRLKDTQGNNGPWFTSAYAVLGGVARSIQVLSGEVQVDASAAVAVTALDGSFNDVVETVVKGALASGTIGNHSVKIRLKDAQGNNGPWFTSAYAVLGGVARSVQVVSGEVQIDNGTTVVVIALDGAFNDVVETVVKGALASGTVGNHTVKLRLKDAQGNNGPWFASAYAVLGSVTRSVQVVNGEVQIDNGTTVAVIALDGSFNDVVETVVKGSLTAGAAGNHTVKIRLKDAQGNNGPWFTSAYAVLGSVARTVQVQSARYWIDGGAKTTLTALDGSFDSVLERAASAAISGLNPGAHKLNIEMQDAQGNWGPTFSAATSVLGAVTRAVSIQTGETWWDNASATPLVVVNDNSSGAIATATQSSASLSVGAHALRIRMRSADGQWGNTVTLAVKVNPCTPVPTAPTASATPATISLGQPTTLAVSGPVAGQTYTWTGPGLAATTGTSVTATPTAAGTATYSVIAVNGGGCPSPATTVTVTVNPNAPAPTITAFSPGSGPVGTTVVLTGTAFTGATSVTIGGVATTFTVNSASQITLTVPAGALTGPIVVTTPGGTGTSSTSFSVVPPPVITAFSPGSGASGTVVTLTGSGFTGATSVKFNGTNATTFTVVSDASVKATVGPTATSGPISLTTANGTATTGSAFAVLPVITSFTPAAGAAVGATVTLTGTNLSGATSVTFNGVAAATFTVLSATSVTAVVPATATSGKLGVVTPGGSALSTAIFKVLPKITSFTPGFGQPHTPATVVTITGSGFTGATAVKFYTAAASFTVVNSTTITATVPAAAVTGKLSVTTAGGTASSTTNFGVAPTISSFTPGAGSAGSVVILTGLNFTTGTTTAVKFNGTAATAVYNSATQLTATVPAGATTGPLTATTAYGSHTTATSYTITTGAAPTITSFAPTANVIRGTVVTITGAHFTGATAVRFNAHTTTAVTVLSDTQVQAAVPTGATTGLLYVVTPTGMAKSAANLTIIQPPTVTSFSPTSGSPGSVVLLAGTNLTGATSVKLNGLDVASYTVNSAAQIAAVVPTGATSGKFSVTTIAGTGTSAANFTVTTAPAPTIVSFTPASGGIGTTVVLTGTNFTGVTSVKFNTVACPVGTIIVDAPTQLTVTVPTGATTGKISVLASGGMAQSATVFTVVAAPKLTAVAPTTGGSPGSTVTLTGTNLTGATSVTFGGVPATSFVVVSATQITAVVPTGAMTGVIQVTTPGGTASTSTSFPVTSGPAPTIVSFSPASGPVGSFVTITGTNLTGATSVKVNAAAVSSFAVVSPNTLTLTVPTGATTGKLTVVTPNGMVISSTAYTVTAAPRITSFTPASGPVGTLVTINGAYLTGLTGVSFGGVAATSFTVVSTSKVTATVPAGAVTGLIQVRNGNAVGASATNFTVLAARDQPLATAAELPLAPTLLTLLPNPAHGSVMIQVSGGRAAAATIELYDVTGRRVRTAVVPTTGPAPLSLADLATGLYWVRCGALTERLVVE